MSFKKREKNSGNSGAGKGEEEEWVVLISHDMPFIKQRNVSPDIKFHFLRSSSETCCNSIISPILLIEHPPQCFNKQCEIFCITWMHDICRPRWGISLATAAEILPVIR